MSDSLGLHPSQQGWTAFLSNTGFKLPDDHLIFQAFEKVPVTPEVFATCPSDWDAAFKEIGIHEGIVRIRIKNQLKKLITAPNQVPSPHVTNSIEAKLNKAKSLIPQRKSQQNTTKLSDAIQVVLDTYKAEEEFYKKHPLLLDTSNYGRFPIATQEDDSIDTVTWGQFLYKYPLLPKTFSAFTNCVNEALSRNNSEQEGKLLMLYQVSRFGKTKLCFSMASKQFVVVIRNTALRAECLESQFHRCVSVFEGLHGGTNDEGYKLAGRLAIQNQHLVFLWVYSYVELLQRLMKIPAFVELGKLQYDCFVRIVSNRIGEKYISGIFNERLGLVEDTPEFEQHIKRLRSFAKDNNVALVFDDFLPEADTMSMDLFPRIHQYEMHLENIGDSSIYNVIGKCQLDAHYKKSEGELERRTSLFYAFVAVAETHVKQGLPAIFTTTRFKAFEHMFESPAGASSRKRLTWMRFWGITTQLQTIPEMVSADMLVDFIQRHINLGEVDEPQLKNALLPYAGRPGFFFDGVWPKVLRAVKECETTEDLFRRIVVLLSDTGDLEAIIEDHLLDWINRQTDDRLLLRRLYYFLVMHNGYTVLNNNETEAISSGFAFLIDVTHGGDKFHARMFAEPLVRKVFLNKADAFHRNALAVPPSEDPIYQEIFLYHQNNIGEPLEEAIMRSYMRKTSMSLYDALDCAASGVQPDSIASHVRFADIQWCGTSVELGVDELEFLLQPQLGVQMRSAFGRVDIITPLVWCDHVPPRYANLHLPPASSHASNLADHITPAMFYGEITMDGVRDGALLTLDPRTFFPNHKGMRDKFFEKYERDPLYTVYVRIIASASGFDDQVREAVTTYNKKSPNRHLQPIILYDVSKEDLGPLHSHVRASVAEGLSRHVKTAWTTPKDDFAIPPLKGKAAPAVQKRVTDFYPLNHNPKRLKTDNTVVL